MLAACYAMSHPPIYRDGGHLLPRYIGISMGRILQNIVRSDYQIDEQVPCTFVPILGGFGESNPNLHSNYLAQEFAERFGGDYVQLLAPALVSNRSVMKYFMEEKPIYKVSRLFKKLSMVIMGANTSTSLLQTPTAPRGCWRQ